jgi:hypothetical protein
LAAIPRRKEELQQLLANQEALQSALQRRYKELSRLAATLEDGRPNGHAPA